MPKHSVSALEALDKAKEQKIKYMSSQWDFVLMGMDEPIPTALQASLDKFMQNNQLYDADDPAILKFKAGIVRAVLQAGAYELAATDSADPVTITQKAAQIPKFGESMYESSEVMQDGVNTLLICNGKVYSFNAKESPLASGENSTVFKGMDIESGEEVVIKRQASEAADIRSLQKEHEFASKYNVDDVSYGKGLASHDDNYYLIQKFVKGKTLNKFSPKDAFATAIDLVSAVKDFQKQTGAMHRDLRPENIMVTEGGKVVLLDPGAASAINKDGIAGAPLGYTPGFTHPFLMAQIYNENDGKANPIRLDVSRRSDPKYHEEILALIPKDKKGEFVFAGILNNPAYSEREEAYALQKVIESIPGLDAVFGNLVCESFAQIQDKLKEVQHKHNNVKKRIPLGEGRVGKLIGMFEGRNKDPNTNPDKKNYKNPAYQHNKDSASWITQPKDPNTKHNRFH